MQEGSRRLKKAQHGSTWLKKAQERLNKVEEAKECSKSFKKAQESYRRFKIVNGYLIDGHKIFQDILIGLGSKLRRLWKVSFFFGLDSLLINCRSFRVPTKALFFKKWFVHYILSLDTGFQCHTKPGTGQKVYYFPYQCGACGGAYETC